MEVSKYIKWECDPSGYLPIASSHGPGRPLVKAFVIGVHADFSGVASRDENEI